MDNVSSPVSSSVPVTPVTQSAGLGQNYASFGSRLLAMILDGFIYGLVFGVIFGVLMVVTGVGAAASGGLNSDGTSAATAGISLVVMGLYFLFIFAILGLNVYLVATKGQTPGKMIAHIKVIRKDGGQLPGFGVALLREIVGRIVNGLVFYLGYLWMLWDPEKQTWGDKVAGTIVVKV